MNSIFRRLKANMVFEAGNSIIGGASAPHLTAYSCRVESHLAKLNGMEHRTYEDAIFALNGLQTNSITLKESIGRTHNTECPHVKETEWFLRKIGITLDDLDQLSVIHVAGTKGKVKNE